MHQGAGFLQKHPNRAYYKYISSSKLGTLLWCANVSYKVCAFVKLITNARMSRDGS